MTGRDPLVGIRKLWAELDELAARGADVRRWAEEEVSRLARNKHRARALRDLYWDPRERTPVLVLSQLFRLEKNAVAAEAGPWRTRATCNLCSREFELELANRSARRDFTRELSSRTKNPQHAICLHCTAAREVGLELMRKKAGEPLDAIHMAAYRQYLQTPQWRERRAQALKRAKNRCQLCGRKGLLEAHHRVYTRLGAERPEDITVLCVGCHSSHHGH